MNDHLGDPGGPMGRENRSGSRAPFPIPCHSTPTHYDTIYLLHSLALPLARLCPRAFEIRIPVFVCPRRRAGDVVGCQVVGIGSKQSGDSLANVSVQKG
jgi:hypothetical protein